MPKYTKLKLARPNGPTEKQIAKWAIHPRIRHRLSAALRRPIFPGQVYISHNGKYVHIRLVSPNKLDKRSFRMKDLGQRGTRGIIGCPSGQYDPATNSCRVGTRLQAVLIPKDRVSELGKQISTLSAPKRKKRYKRNPMSFEQNPLLMTVTNPGPEYGFRSNPVDVEYDPGQQMFKVHRSNPGAGYHSNPENPLTREEALEISGRASDFGYKSLDLMHEGNVDEAFKALGRGQEDVHIASAYSENPRHDEDEDSSGEMGYGWCRMCSGPLMCLGNLGNRVHLRCRNCGADQSRERKDTDPTQFENNRRHYCDNPGNCADPVHYNDNASRRGIGWHTLDTSFKTSEDARYAAFQLCSKTGAEFQAAGKRVIFYGHASRVPLYRRYAEEMRKYGFNNNPKRKRRRKYKDNNPPHYRPKGAPVTGRRIVRGTPTTGEYYDRKGQVTALRKQPSQRHGGRMGKSTIKGRKIPIQKFMAWLKRSGTPDEWRRFMKEMAAYRKFHKGAEPKFITRKLVDVGAGRQVIGRAFGYSMGKSPFEPYITPSGSGKGNKTPYLHEYETLPDGITNSTGKVVIKPLEGRTKITDWIHY